MAVEEHRHPEPPSRALDEGLQLRMIGAVQRVNPAKAISNRDRFFVDRLRIADDPWNGAEPNRDPQGAGVRELGEAALENLGVKFVRLSIHVEIRAGKKARKSGAPSATHGRNSSSTKASSDRRRVSGSRREAARKHGG